MKTTVLFLIDSLQFLGGAEKNLITIASGLNPDKYRAVVCCLKSGNAYEAFRNNRIDVINLQIERIYGFPAFIKAIKLINIIRREKVKVMVTYLESSDFWGSIVGKIAGVPVLISSRRDMGFNLKTRHILAYRIINHLFTRIIAVCDAVKETIVKREKAHPDKIVTIYNGVDFPGVSEIDKQEFKKSLGLDINKQTVTMLANFAPIKGHREFLQSAKEVIRNNDSTQFLLVGTGENGYRKFLYDFSCQLGIKDYVVFAGFRPDILSVLSVSDISVLSSTSEGFSNTILESMAAGKPVVATNVGGNPEAVTHGETGLLVSSGDTVGLTQSLLCLLEDKELARKMGEAGRGRVRKFFTNERMIVELETLFDVLVEQRGTKRKAKIKKILKKIFKTAMVRVLYFCGVIYIYQRLQNKNNLRILTYHKVSDNCPYLGLATGASNFRKEMEFLRRHYRIITLDEAVNLLKKRERIPRKTVVITFDDGDKGIFHNAFPVLKELQIPATIFLTVNPIETKEPVWFDFVIYTIENTKRRTLNLGRFGLGKYLLNTQEEKKEAIESIVSFIKTLDKKKWESFFNFLYETLAIERSVSQKLSKDILEWEDIKFMKDNGITFGAHTMTHPILTNISLEEARREICDSKKIIEERIGEEVRLFAYPNGARNDFNQGIIDILKNNYFSCACTMIDGADNSNPFALRRVCINDECSTDINGSFSNALFATRILGFFSFFNKS